MMKKSERIEIRTITVNDPDRDFYYLFNQFLDNFYRADDATRQMLIEQEPTDMLLPEKERCLLAATAQELAVEYNLQVPSWATKAVYYPQAPIFAFSAKDKTFCEYLISTSLPEFKKHELYLGDNILRRV